MSISKEVGGVSNNLANVEALASVDTVGQDASLEGSSEAAGGNAALIGAGRVGEGNTRRSRAALGRLVDMCASQGHGLVFAGDAGEGDVLR